MLSLFGSQRRFTLTSFLAPFLLAALALAGCASLPENYPREESLKLDASDTQLAQAFAAVAADHPGQSGAYPLGQGIEALAARVALARAADKSLDVQYYIWHADESGRLLLEELLDAADRGEFLRHPPVVGEVVGLEPVRPAERRAGAPPAVPGSRAAPGGRLAILQKDRQRDKPGEPSSGYTRDAVPMLVELWPLAAKHGVKFVLKAGGLNPQAAREALARAFHAKGWTATIATVTGDSVLGRLDELRAAGESLTNMDTGADLASVRERLLFANAYLGAQPIGEALSRGAEIVLTGRVAARR